MRLLLSEFRAGVEAGRCCGRNDSDTVMVTVLHSLRPRQHDSNGGGHDWRGQVTSLLFTWIKVFVSLRHEGKKPCEDHAETGVGGVGVGVGWRHAGLYQTTTVLLGG